ncbi:MAG TPA: methyltransferase domain-containing protein [Candidatus Limnocylindrales bacterium]|nr:methyltransferase domain-containing protein [Candidatus Limnocylindrales bacterium]
MTANELLSARDDEAARDHDGAARDHDGAARDHEVEAAEGEASAGLTPSRYDEMADGYARFWAPVLRESAERVLEHLEPAVEAALTKHLSGGGEPARLLDVGSGTGTLALAAIRRWPGLHVTGIDPSSGMLEVARRTAAALAPEAASRFQPVVAYADELPEDLGPFDAAMSSFVLQLVPSRAGALREVRRVLAPGGTFAWVTWQQSDRAFEPDRVANAVLDEFGFDPPEPDSRPGDVASPAAAALAMRRAGFRNATAWSRELTYAWDPKGYLEFLTDFDEASLFDDLEPDERARIEARILAGLERLTDEQRTLRLPIVYAMGTNPG